VRGKDRKEYLWIAVNVMIAILVFVFNLASVDLYSMLLFILTNGLQDRSSQATKAEPLKIKRRRLKPITEHAPNFASTQEEILHLLKRWNGLQVRSNQGKSFDVDAGLARTCSPCL